MIGDDPFIDWSIILALSVVAAAILVAVGASVYVDGAAELASPPQISPAISQASHFDIQSLDRITGAFDARAAERVLLDKAYSGPPDPSLP